MSPWVTSAPTERQEASWAAWSAALSGLASITSPDRPPHLTFPAPIPDDAVLALALAEALSAPTQHLTGRIAAAFTRWWVDDRHGQAPDRDTLRGCKALHEARLHGTPWTQSAPLDAVSPAPLTRAHPVGLFAPAGRVSSVAATQAALTHGHPVPVTAAVGWAQVVHEAARGAGLQEWADVYTGAVARVGWAGGEQQGTMACLDAWGRVERARAFWEPGADPLPRRIGGDVTAAEVAAGCLFYAQTMADDPIAAVLTVAQAPSPAPDMCAAATGALLGAWHGRGVWASSWVSAVDASTRARVERLVDAWVRTPVG